MDKKKLPLEQLKVKSFVTVMESADQKTAIGGNIDIGQQPGYHSNWTIIKTQKSVYSDAEEVRFSSSSRF